MASARENDLNPDIRIGLKLPFNRGRSGLFPQTQTTLEQAGSNIKNLLLTAKGERIMQPNFGSRLRELLFEQYTEDLSSRIQSEIQEAISTWLPYINISSVTNFIVPYCFEVLSSNLPDRSSLLNIINASPSTDFIHFIRFY